MSDDDLSPEVIRDVLYRDGAAAPSTPDRHPVEEIHLTLKRATSATVFFLLYYV